MNFRLIFKKIQSATGVNFTNLAFVLPFGGQKEFEICDFFDLNGKNSWGLVNMESGNLVRHVAYEPGFGYHWGSVVFNVSANGSSAVVLDPEFGLGIAFFTDGKDFKVDLHEWRKDFYYTCFWKKECYRNNYYIDMIDDWMNTLEDITGLPRLVL